MFPYFALLAISSLISHLAQKYRNNYQASNFCFLIIFVILVAFAGCRYRSIGTDTNQYVDFFESNLAIKSGIFELFNTLGVGIVAIAKFIRYFSSEYLYFLTTVAMISVYPSLKTMKVLSYNYFISIFIYITLGYYLFFFNGAKQGMAASIVGFSMISLVKGDFKHYVFWILIASLFHPTALLMILFYFVLRENPTLRKKVISTIILITGFLFAFYYFNHYSDSFSERYAAYFYRGARGGYLLTIFYVGITFVLIILRRYIKSNDYPLYKIFLKLNILTSFIYIVVFFAKLDVNFIRITQYFAFGTILIWPIVFKNIPWMQNLYVLFIIIHIIFFYFSLDQIANLTPYRFNPTLTLN